MNALAFRLFFAGVFLRLCPRFGSVLVLPSFSFRLRPCLLSSVSWLSFPSLSSLSPLVSFFVAASFSPQVLVRLRVPVSLSVRFGVVFLFVSSWPLSSFAFVLAFVSSWRCLPFRFVFVLVFFRLCLRFRFRPCLPLRLWFRFFVAASFSPQVLVRLRVPL